MLYFPAASQESKEFYYRCAKSRIVGKYYAADVVALPSSSFIIIYEGFILSLSHTHLFSSVFLFFFSSTLRTGIRWNHKQNEKKRNKK